MKQPKIEIFGNMWREIRMKKLQEIKQKYKDNFFNFNYFNIYSDDYDWLLHQVERMDELEGNYNHLNESFRLQTNSAVKGWGKVIELERENERYKQALEMIVKSYDAEQMAIFAEEALKGYQNE